MNSNSHALPIGQQLIGQYEVVKILGIGGFGITYLANDMRIERKVAIKEYLPTDFAVRDTSETVRALSSEHIEFYDRFKHRFLDEAKTLAKFQHPAIVRVMNFFEANGTAYLVMEFEEGRDLRNYLDEHKTLTEREIIELLKPLLDGLKALHEAGLVHRDIKPANIYLRKDGSPVLLDFGAARQTVANQTKNLTAILTPGYSPVEQYQTDVSGQGPWSDIYAMSAVLYEMVSGRKPIESNSRIVAIHSGQEDPVQSAVILGEGKYSAHFLQAIDHGLQVAGQMRPQNVDEWKSELIVNSDDTSEAHTSLKAEFEKIKQEKEALELHVQHLGRHTEKTQAVTRKAEPNNNSEPGERKKGKGMLLSLVAIVFLILGSVFYFVYLNEEADFLRTSDSNEKPGIQNKTPIQTDKNVVVKTLKINSRLNNNNVIIDGKRYGTTPLSIKLKPGNYVVKVKKSGYETYQRQISLVDDSTHWIELKPQKYVLTIRSNVNGDTVYIDGIKYGATRLDVKLMPGKHKVEIKKDGFKTYKKNIVLNKDITVRAILNKLPVAKAVKSQSSAGDIVVTTALGKRVALVIGNSTYQNIPTLPKSKNDAIAFAEKLEGLGFEVIKGLDLTKVGMDQMARRFSEKLKNADVGLFYYAGHGAQVGGVNYLIPVNADVESEEDLLYEAKKTNSIIYRLEREKVKINLVFLDAHSDYMKIGSIGLARSQMNNGFLIAHATQPGVIAVDGRGQHSPFTEALLKYIDEPGLEISKFMRLVRNHVEKRTNGLQIPWVNSLLTMDFSFTPQK
jgi:serine/threonine protein kinase